MEGERFVQIAAADRHSLGCTAAGGAYAWGSVALSRVGLPDEELPDDGGGGGGVVQDGAVWRPTRIPGLQHTEVSHVAAGRAHSLAVSSDGKLYAWGCARYGRLGLGDTSRLPADPSTREKFQQEPRIVHALTDLRVVGAAAGESHSLAICVPPGNGGGGGAAGGGAVYAFGLAIDGRLGLPLGDAATARGDSKGDGGDGGGGGGASLSTPRAVTVPPWAQLDPEDEEPYAPIPTAVPALRHARVVSVAAGPSHSLAIAADGRAFGWGLASHGRLGLGNRPLHIDDDGDAFAAEPLPLHSLAGAGARAVAAGAAHALCLMDGGQLYVWGAARAGRLGFDEGALRMPVNEADETAYQPLPRQVWVSDA